MANTKSTNGNGQFDPFSFMKDFDPMKSTEQFTKMWSEYGVPTVNVDAFVSTQRKTVEAMSAANAKAIEGVREISQRQAEIVRRAVEESADAANKIGKAKSPKEAAELQAEYAKSSFEKAMSDLGDFRELVLKTNNDVVAPINDRIREGFDEMKTYAANFEQK